MKAIMVGALMSVIATTAGAQSVLTLACTGTVKDNILDSIEKVQTGVIVNFQTKQVTGLLAGWDARIDRVDDTSIAFSGISSKSRSPVLTDGGGGSIDRITGSLTANIFAWERGKTEPTTNYSVDLICKPAQRLF